MKIIKLVAKNAARHKLRTLLTAVGIAIAIVAFGILRTVIDAYFIGVEASSDNRLITRNAVSLTFPLPLAYKEKVEAVPNVTRVSYGFWFGATYIDQKNFFAQFAVEPEGFLDLYPEFILPKQEKADFLRERNSCIVGRKLANKYGWKVGDTFRLIGTIFPGDWDFVIRGIYDGRDPATDESTMYFHWAYIDETYSRAGSSRIGQVGFYYIGVDKAENAVTVGDAVDALFENSSAETLTETEKEFQMSFIAMVGTVITAVRVISMVVIAIILLVLANTMAMTARERISEYAVLRTIGFKPKHIAGLVFGESVTIALFGGALGLIMTMLAIRRFGEFLEQNMGGFFPIFEISGTTIILAIASALAVGLLAATFPTLSAVRIKIADGLRRAG